MITLKLYEILLVNTNDSNEEQCMNYFFKTKYSVIDMPEDAYADYIADIFKCIYQRLRSHRYA